ncbi:type 1 glutamine amidotransferase domain-containing protein [Bradyrhizobium sp. MOS001]|nr:type 1 glutamine amidotransferase domain-containing protein [Bradyrhizobium sp. MOS001]
MTASAQTKGKVLVVMSSANALDLNDGKTYKTGYYLNEFVVPYRKLVEAGYEPVIANPKGDLPVMDVNSNNAMFFGGDDDARAAALKYAEGLEQLKHPKTLASVVSEGTNGYVGLFIPGGHAPMVDLLKDKNLGKILTRFHESGRPSVRAFERLLFAPTAGAWQRSGQVEALDKRGHTAASSSRRLQHRDGRQQPPQSV